MSDKDDTDRIMKLVKSPEQQNNTKELRLIKRAAKILAEAIPPQMIKSPEPEVEVLRKQLISLKRQLTFANKNTEQARHATQLLKREYNLQKEKLINVELELTAAKQDLAKSQSEIDYWKKRFHRVTGIQARKPDE